MLETVDLSALGAIAMKRFKLNVNKVNFMYVASGWRCVVSKHTYHGARSKHRLGPVSYIPEKKTAKPRPAKQRIDEKDKVKPLQVCDAAKWCLSEAANDPHGMAGSRGAAAG